MSTMGDDDRLGHSIQNGSESCSGSELSFDDSQRSCHGNTPAENDRTDVETDPMLSLEFQSTTSNDGSTPLIESSSGEANMTASSEGSTGRVVIVLRNLPRTLSFRSRLRRRSEDELYADETGKSVVQNWNEEEDEIRIVRPFRSPSIRLFLTFCALALVLVSPLTNHNTVNGARNSTLRSDSRRKEVAFPIGAASFDEPRSGIEIGRSKLRAESLPRYYLQSDEGNIKNTSNEAKALKLKTSTAPKRLRSNIAMARSHEQRPVFGAAPNPQIERFVMKRVPAANSSGRPCCTGSWTSWIAYGAVILLLVEAGYMEYRHCRADIGVEEHRRL